MKDSDNSDHLDNLPGVVPAVEAALVPDQLLHAGVPAAPGRGEASAVAPRVPGSVLIGTL